MISFSHMIFYVKDISTALVFYQKAFDIHAKFVHESNQYAELNTGATSIAFASEALGEANLPGGYIKNNLNQLPVACEIVLTVDDVQQAYDKAVSAGGTGE